MNYTKKISSDIHPPLMEQQYPPQEVVLVTLTLRTMTRQESMPNTRSPWGMVMSLLVLGTQLRDGACPKEALCSIPRTSEENMK